MTNPLIQTSSKINLLNIKPEYIKEAIEFFIAKEKTAVEKLISLKNPTWENAYQEIELIDQEFGKLMSSISHIKGVTKNDELEDVYEKCIPMLIKHSTEMGQNKELYEVYNSLDKKLMSKTRKIILEKTLKGFKDSGIALPLEEKKKFNEIACKLSELSNAYSRNIQDHVADWSLHFETKEELKGLPESALERLSDLAKSEGKSGYLVKLIVPYYLDILTYATDRDLRKKVFIANAEIATEFGEFDNRPLLTEIIKLKNEKSKLLGYENFVEYSLSSKMANSLEEIESLLLDLNNKSIDKAKEEYSVISDFAIAKDNLTSMNGWDQRYYNNLYKEEKFNINVEEIKEYFPVEKVKSGLFWLISELYDVEIKEEEFENPHSENLSFCSIYKEGEKKASFLLDLYSNPNKRGGAWMSDYQNKLDYDSVSEKPIAFIVCNFAKPTEKMPSLLSFNDVETLFHEMGHGLHQMLTEVEDFNVAGINGVPWDAVELPSQFMEYFCMNEKVLEKISGHYKTNEPLNNDLREKIKNNNNFLSAMNMVKQVELSLADLYVYNAPERDPYEVLAEVRKLTHICDVYENDRFLNNFSHIFSGGYAVGYYGYKWADVLSADVFETFEENGVLCKETAQRFLKEILSKGGSDDINEMFKNFKGREPSVDAFLKHSGIIN
jgi:oligopeptidase A